MQHWLRALCLAALAKSVLENFDMFAKDEIGDEWLGDATGQMKHREDESGGSERTIALVITILRPWCPRAPFQPAKPSFRGNCPKSHRLSSIAHRETNLLVLSAAVIMTECWTPTSPA
jgi:hypothetical protein